ncbi:uncharacterized protein EV422DRAFT_483138, partial [Fimicolochytrium jonesii]|uniref:uncharacterized protein n=1 Tax=Fimicolochytrium jonesii TaxID=1396493 RepID=UPI0022FDC77B
AEKAVQGAYMYPVSGVLYFANHTDLVKPIAGVLAKSALTSLGITALMFFFTFLPQMAFLSLIATPFLGIPAAIVLVLVESWLLINVVVKAIFIGPLQDDLFDRVLAAEGHKDLVAQGKTRLTPSGPHAHVAKAIRKRMDRFSPAAMLQFLMTLPLTFIPVIGPVSFFVINGKKMGASFHTRYFALKGWNAQQVEQFQKSRGPAYTAFGVVALALQLIPVVGVFFTATSTVGAAIWAADLER